MEIPQHYSIKLDKDRHIISIWGTITSEVLFTPATITATHIAYNIQAKNKKDYDSEHSTIDLSNVANKNFACAKPEHKQRKNAKNLK